MKYWDIGKILAYQRNFNFINGERSIGKTYTTIKFCINRAITRGQEFVYIVRTQYEKLNNALELALQKVLMNEFPELNIKFTTEKATVTTENENGQKTTITLAYCLALTEAVKIKKMSFPNVKYMIFDEYMLEENRNTRYVDGWREPDLLLNIYHTIDREEDRVIVFMLGNNTSFYLNPYHRHAAFNIPKIDKGKIWTSENVLFQWAEATEELKQEKSKSKFIKMISDSEYGQYAAKGEYINDVTDFVEIRPNSARPYFTILYESEKYGIWYDAKTGYVFIDDRYDPSIPSIYALTLADHTEDTVLVNKANSNCIKWLSKMYKLGNVKFTSMKIKAKAEQMFRIIC